MLSKQQLEDFNKWLREEYFQKPTEEAEDLAKAAWGYCTDKFKPYWPKGVKPDMYYEIPCDDKGRNGTSWLRVLISGVDGDVYLSMQDWEDAPEGSPTPYPSIRVRTFAGGGRQDKTRQALLSLAEAIMLDKEENTNGHI